MSTHQAIAPGPPLSMLDAAAQFVGEQARDLRHHGRRVRRKGSEDAVHEMRVATRRLRTALRALKGHVAPPGRLPHRLKWLAGKLGAVRDRDVVIALLMSERLPAAAREERERLARLIERLEGKRRKALKALRDALGRKRYDRLREELREFARAPVPSHSDYQMASRVLAGVSESLGAEVARSEAMTAPAPDEKALHRLRILFKRLRYALDFHAAASGLSYDAERRMARAIQDVLGEIHDRDLLLGWLAEGVAPFEGSWPALCARLGDERARLVRRFLRLRREWLARTRPEPMAPLEAPRFATLEVQPVTLRLVTGPRSVASTGRRESGVVGRKSYVGSRVRSDSRSPGSDARRATHHAR